MSTVKTGWLNDNNGDKFAPKTLVSQVVDNNGIGLEEKINENFLTLENSVEEKLNAKADSGHSHSISDVANLQTSLDAKATQANLNAHTGNTTAHITSTERTNWNNALQVGNIATGSSNGTISVKGTNVAVKGLGSAAYTASTAYDAAGTAQAKADTAEANAKSYTDTKVANLLNNSTEAVDSIMELAAAMEANDDVVDALSEAVGKKVDKVSGKGLSTNDLTATLKANYDTAYSHVSNKSNPHGVTLSQLGVNATATELNYMDGVTSSVQTQLDAKSDSGHTHNYAGSSSAGGAATSANKVNKSLIVKLNSGSTEETNQFTFDGSTAKAVNITPSSIGAAVSSHAHDDKYYTKEQIDTYEFITVNDIDTICGGTVIQMAREVMF